MEKNMFVNHEMEQAEAGIRDLAKLMRSFYNNLADEGFDDPQALTLTRQYLASVIRGGIKRDED